MNGLIRLSSTTTQLLSAGDANDSMLPSRQPPPPSKRKGAEDGNPLNQLTKKSKTESSSKSAAAKRKLIGEEQPGGLIIVRASSARPPHSQEIRPTPVDVPPPPRHSSVPPPSRTATNGTVTNGTHSGHPSKKFRADPHDSSTSGAAKGKGREVLGSVAEADEDEDIRRMQAETDILRRKSLAGSANVDPAFQFLPPGHPSKSSKPNQTRGRIRELSQPLPLQETPQQDRNRFLRGETGGHRRRSSLTRGKRISSTYQATGVIDLAQPHTSVRDSSFYKHIDVESPEPQRAQQLLIWCTHRAVNELAEQSTQAASSRRSATDAGKDPPLSPEDVQLLKGLGEDLIRMLAEKKIDTNVYSRPGDEEAPRQLKENAQNVRNRAREVEFNAHIQKLKQEDEAWVEVGSSYNSFRTTVLSELEEQKKRFPSAKAKGKRPATTEDIALWEINEQDLPEHFRGKDCLALAKSLINPAPARSALSQRIEGLEMTVDRLHSLAHAALESTRLAEADLNRRFSSLNIFLASRIQPLNPLLASSATALSSYLPASSARPPPTTDPQALLRALSRVDAERPQTQVGDAARRAAREVQRAHDASAGIAERRLTGVPPPTPRKPPGTPRRATTPGRGR